MFVVDLCRKRQSSSADMPTEPETAWRLATDLARAKPDLAFRIPLGPDRRDRAELDGRLLAESGLRLF